MTAAALIFHTDPIGVVVAILGMGAMTSCAYMARKRGMDAEVWLSVAGFGLILAALLTPFLVIDLICIIVGVYVFVCCIRQLPFVAAAGFFAAVIGVVGVVTGGWVA